MLSSRVDVRELVAVAVEALGRYRLRTALSVLGIVLGVAAVIAMMSVSEGAAREALAQVEGLGLDNLVARSRTSSANPVAWRGLTVSDADRAAALVPLARAASPLVERAVMVSRGSASIAGHVLGVRPAYQTILRLTMGRGRFLSAADERSGTRVCVLGAALARRLFGYRDPLDDTVRVGQDHYRVVGVLRAQGGDPTSGGTMAWRDIGDTLIVPFGTLTGRTPEVAPDQPADEVWLQVRDGAQAEVLAPAFAHLLDGRGRRAEFDLVVPRELLAQRYRMQRTFSVVVGSVAVLALIVGGIGIMNIMLTSVVERTREIGVRRTSGATRRDIARQFLVEALLMTVGGGAVGIATGAVVAVGISVYADWRTHVSPAAVLLGFAVSCLVGITFGLYPAIKAAALQPVDAMRYE